MPRGRARRSIATTRERIPHRQGDRRRPSRGTSRPTGKTGETREGNPIGSQRIHSTCSPTDLIFIIFESGGKGSLFCNGKKRSRFDSAQPNDTSKKCFLSLEKLITNLEFFTTHTGLTPLSCLEGILFSQSIMPQPSGRTYPETLNILRPLSPHLPIYKPQLTSTFSIFHRISGAFLATIVLFFYLLCLKMGLICFTYENFYQFFFYFYSSKLILISVEITALALSYHLYNGVRHLLTDFSGFLFLRIGRKRLK